MINPSRDDSCKGCSADVNVSEQQIDRMLASLHKKGFNCVPDEIYQNRIAICRECPSLAFGNTCLHCGCIVQIRAKFKEKGCPNPGSPKWRELMTS